MFQLEWRGVSIAEVTESAATWNTYDGTNAWYTAGAYGSGDTEQTSLGCANTTASLAVGTEIQITLSPAQVQEMVNGTWENRGFLVRMVGEGDQNRYDFYSSDEATYTARRPKLVINYTVGISPTPTATSTPMLPPSGYHSAALRVQCPPKFANLGGEKEGSG